MKETPDLINRYIYFYKRIRIKNRSGIANAAPLRLELNISAQSLVFLLPACAGQTPWIVFCAIKSAETPREQLGSGELFAAVFAPRCHAAAQMPLRLVFV